MEGGGEVKDNSFLGKRVTKRKFIKGAAVAGVVVSAAASGLEVVGLVTGDQGTKTPKTSKLDEVNLFEEKTEKTTDDLIKENPMFINCTDAEKETALKIIKDQINHYSGLFRRFKTLESITKTLNLKDQVDKSYEFIKGKIDSLALNKNGLSDKQIKELLLYIIFVESGGEANANSSAKAKGLCQLIPKTAEENAKIVGIPFSEKKLMNPDYNIQLASVHLRRLLNAFHDPSIALWAYHLGDGNMIDVLEIYLKSTLEPEEYQVVVNELGKGMRSPKFDKIDMETIKDNRKSTARIVDYYKLNFVKLITSKAVQAWLEERRNDKNPVTHIGDDTEKYVPRLGTAGYFLREIKKASSSNQ